MGLMRGPQAEGQEEKMEFRAEKQQSMMGKERSAIFKKHLLCVGPNIHTHD